MRALGAEVINTPTERGMTHAIEKAKQLASVRANAYIPNQFHNEDNPTTYYDTLGPEIMEEMDGKVDIFISGAGSGGTCTGFLRYLKENNPHIKTRIVEQYATGNRGVGKQLVTVCHDRARDKITLLSSHVLT